VLAELEGEPVTIDDDAACRRSTARPAALQYFVAASIAVTNKAFLLRVRGAGDAVTRAVAINVDKMRGASIPAGPVGRGRGGKAASGQSGRGQAPRGPPGTLQCTDASRCVPIRNHPSSASTFFTNRLRIWRVIPAS